MSSFNLLFGCFCLFESGFIFISGMRLYRSGTSYSYLFHHFMNAAYWLEIFINVPLHL